MSRKKSIRLIAEQFKSNCDHILDYLRSAKSHLSDEHLSWCYDYAIIRLYREFEDMILGAMIGAINNDTTTISHTTGYMFPKHITDEICEYLVIGTGYFDFKGRNSLIGILKKYIPDNHYLVLIVKKKKYKNNIERLSALRNFAAHGSSYSKKSALNAVGQNRVGSSGSWLKRQGRFSEMINNLKELADEIRIQAPY